eukprot:scaffold75508_cov27-Phaeocystis_antarctica.AAC.1
MATRASARTWPSYLCSMLPAVVVAAAPAPVGILTEYHPNPNPNPNPNLLGGLLRRLAAEGRARLPSRSRLLHGAERALRHQVRARARARARARVRGRATPWLRCRALG